MNNIEELKAAATAMRLSSTMRISDEAITFRRLFTPDCALALIAQLEAALSAANEKILVPGVLRCAKCSFQLAKTNLYMASGTTGPGDNKTEPCPNGCGPLWPVTWEQWSREIGVQLDRYFDEAKELKGEQVLVCRINGSELQHLKNGRYAIVETPEQHPTDMGLFTGTQTVVLHPANNIANIGDNRHLWHQRDLMWQSAIKAAGGKVEGE
jgi:hypothetical protein